MSRRLTMLILALVSVGVVVFGWLMFSSPPVAEKLTTTPPTSAPSGTHPAAEVAQVPSNIVEPGNVDPGKPLASGMADEDLSPAENAQRLREALMVVAGGAGGGPAQPDTVPVESEQYVARLLEDVVAQTVGACYEQLLEQEPQAAGSIVLKLPLLGNESLGAVFVDVGFGEASTLTQPSFRGCLKDGLMTSVLEAPPGARSQLSITQVFDLEP